MTAAIWLRYIGTIVAGVVFFYLYFWIAESVRGRSWQAGHERLWKKPKRTELIAFCVLWGFVVVAIILLLVLAR